MRKIFTLKILLRSPLKTAITFFLIAAASFTLCSNITDYTVTRRETENARSFYHGVAALDNSVPDITSATVDNVTYYYDTQDKPWPADEQIEEFSSLPGVTLADKRYMTAGLIEDYRRLTDKDYSGRSTAQFVVEGTYSGYEDIQDSGLFIDLLLNDVTVLAGDMFLICVLAVNCVPNISKSAISESPKKQAYWSLYYICNSQKYSKT